MAWVNAVAARVCEVALGPILNLPPLAGLLILSAITSVVMLLVIARTSDQARLSAAKRAIHAALFEIRLFNDDPIAMLRALGDVLKQNAIYLRLSLVPMVWMIVPLTLVVAHLQAFYGYAGLTPGEPAILKVELRHRVSKTDAPAGALALDVPAGVRVDTKAVRLSASDEVLWRIVPTVAGDYTLTVHVGSDTATKTLHVSDRPARRSPKRVSAGILNQFLYPSEPLLPGDGSIAAMTVTYSEPGIAVASWRVHWMVVYAVLSMACAFVLARRFGVTI